MTKKTPTPGHAPGLPSTLQLTPRHAPGSPSTVEVSPEIGDWLMLVVLASGLKEAIEYLEGGKNTLTVQDQIHNLRNGLRFLDHFLKKTRHSSPDAVIQLELIEKAFQQIKERGFRQ